MRAAVVAEWVIVSGGWNLFRTMREQALTPTLARQAAEWCERQGDTGSSSELLWAAREAEKWCEVPESQESEPDIIMRIDDLLSADAMSWSPVGEDEAARILAGEQAETPKPWVSRQIHALPVSDAPAWRTWWDRLSEDEQEEVPWYVVCFGCMAVGEREVTCGCGNPSGQGDSR